MRDNLVSCSQDTPSPPCSPTWRSRDDNDVDEDDICGVSSSTADDLDMSEPQQQQKQQSTSATTTRVKTESSSAASVAVINVEPLPGPSRTSPQPGPSGKSLIGDLHEKVGCPLITLTRCTAHKKLKCKMKTSTIRTTFFGDSFHVQ